MTFPKHNKPKPIQLRLDSPQLNIFPKNNLIKQKKQVHDRTTYSLPSSKADLKLRMDMWESQNKKCYVCNKEIYYGYWVLDHNHKTGKIRGLACRSCNRKLGTKDKQIERKQDDE